MIKLMKREKFENEILTAYDRLEDNKKIDEIVQTYTKNKKLIKEVHELLMSADQLTRSDLQGCLTALSMTYI